MYVNFTNAFPFCTFLSLLQKDRLKLNIKSYVHILLCLISADADLLSEYLIKGLEQEYQKYNVLSTEDLTRHFITK